MTAATPAFAQQSTPSPFAPGGPLEPFRTPPHRARHARQRRYTPYTAAWIEWHAGLGTPVGIAGAAVDLQPVPWFALNGGTGASYRGPLQVAITPRLRYPFGKGPMAVGFGAGYSLGGYKRTNAGWSAGGGDQAGTYWKTWDRAEWVNLELSVERRLAPIGWRIYVGRAILQSHHPSTCIVNTSAPPPTTCEVSTDAVMWYAGFAYAFGAGW